MTLIWQQMSLGNEVFICVQVEKMMDWKPTTISVITFIIDIISY